MMAQILSMCVGKEEQTSLPSRAVLNFTLALRQRMKYVTYV